MNNNDLYFNLMINAIKHNNVDTFDWILRSGLVEKLNRNKNYLSELAFTEEHLYMLMKLSEFECVYQSLEIDNKEIFDFVTRKKLEKKVNEF